MSDPFKSKALLGMKSVGVFKFWKCLSVHNELDTVGLPLPTPISFPPHPHYFFCVYIMFHFIRCLEKAVRTSVFLLAGN